MKNTSLFCTRFYLLAAVFVTAVVVCGTAFCQQGAEPRHSYETTGFFWLEDCTEAPILRYRGSRGHHGQRISDSDLEEVFIWKDGTIAWKIAPKDQAVTEARWYLSTVLAGKVEVAVQEITENFAKYPSQNRPRRSGVFFRLGANYSPSIEVNSSPHYESLWVDHILWTFYKKNREVLQSGDNEAILNIIKGIGGFPPGQFNEDGQYTGLHPAYKFDYRGLVEYYRGIQPHAGLSEKRNPDYNDEEILKAVEFYTADAGHLLLMEEKVLELLPSTEGLEPEKIFSKSLLQHLKPEGKVQLGITEESRFYIWHDFHIEREIKDGKTEFFYTKVSASEKSKIWQELREKKEQQKKADEVRLEAIEKFNERPGRGPGSHLKYEITVTERPEAWSVRFMGKSGIVGDHGLLVKNKATGEWRYVPGM